MSESMSSLLNEYGTLFLFVNVLLVQSGFPIPAVPFLVVAGGLAAAGQLDPLLIIAAAVAASMLADYGWYLAGRRIGPTLLTRLCSLSLSPGLCARRVEAGYGCWGGGLLLFAKFIPGLAMIAPPMAGALRMPRHVFLLYAGMGALLWSGTFVALGYVLDLQAKPVFALLDSFGHYTILAVAAALATYLLYRLVRRKRLLNMFQATRFSADQVRQRFAAPTTPVLIDMRSPVAGHLDGRRLPAAISGESHLVVLDACPNGPAAAPLRRILFSPACIRSVTTTRISK